MRNTKDNYKNGEIIIYKGSKSGVRLDVYLKKDTVWLSQAQIAQLFDTQRPAITKHLNNIFNSGELKIKSVSSILEHTATDGKKYKIRFYNLDAIISIGYRVNSQYATNFRIWATQILKSHIVKGYTINKKQLLKADTNLKTLKETIAFLYEKSQKDLTSESQKILELLAGYSKTLSLLEQYDKGKIKSPKGKKTNIILTYEECVEVIIQLKKQLFTKKEASDLFGAERGGAFNGIVNNLYQTFSKKDLYSTAELKAAHLLYLTIKGHPFSDGNKRIGSFLFVYFLDKAKLLYNKIGERVINDNTLLTLALLIAESIPKEKDVLIGIIVSLLYSKT